MAEVEVLTRDKAIREGVLPTGRKVGIVPIRGYNLYEIKYIDGNGEIPDAYKSRYTALHYADKELKRFLNDFWDISDKATRKKTLPLSESSNAERR